MAWDQKVAVKPKVRAAMLAMAFLQPSDAYIFIRSLNPTTAFVEMVTPDLPSFLWYIIGAQFKSAFFPFGLQELITIEIPFAIIEILRQFSFFLIIAAWGFWKKKNSIPGIFFCFIIVSYFLFALNYGIFDIQPYFIPLYIPIALFLGMGLQSLQDKYFKKSSAFILMLFGLPLALLSINYTDIDLSLDTSAEEIENVLEAVQGNALLLPSDYSTAAYLWYYTIGEGLEEKNQIYAALQYPQLDLKDIIDYVADQKPLELPFEQKEAPPGLSVYSLGKKIPALLIEAGLELELVNQFEPLYKVTGFDIEKVEEFLGSG